MSNFNLFLFTQIQVQFVQMFMSSGDLVITFEPQDYSIFQPFNFDLENDIEVWLVKKPLEEQIQWFVEYKSNEYILIDYSYEKPLNYTIMKVVKKNEEGDE